MMTLLNFREIREVLDLLLKKGSLLRLTSCLKGLWIPSEGNILMLLHILIGATVMEGERRIGVFPNLHLTRFCF